ncbi:MAG: TetR family transcriptional regulator C-terminal domain-containing protein [Fusobacterium sp.]
MDKKNIKKNLIIEKSIGLMYLNGYNGTSVKDITDAAGIPKGSFYNYFIGKEQYAINAIDFYEENINCLVETLENNNLKPLDRIKNFYKEKIKILEERGVEYGCFVGNLSEEVGNNNENISKRADEFHKKIESVIVKNLIIAEKENMLKKNVSPKILGDFILISWQGALLRAKVAKNILPVEEFYEVLTKELLI